MSTSETLTDTVNRVRELVRKHNESMPFRAPETHDEWNAQLLNNVYQTLEANRDRPSDTIQSILNVIELQRGFKLMVDSRYNVVELMKAPEQFLYGPFNVQDHTELQMMLSMCWYNDGRVFIQFLPIDMDDGAFLNPDAEGIEIDCSPLWAS